MSRSAFTDAHQVLVRVLVDARKEAGLHQAQVAELLGKDQSFISNIERGQRRVDVIEFCALAAALGIDPTTLFGRIAQALPNSIMI